LEEMGETDRFTCFMAGLQSKTRGEILRLKVTTLDVAIKTANQLNAERNQERELGSLNYLKVNENKGKIKEKQRKCFKCGGVGHIQRDCPSNSNEAESSENEVIDDNDEVKKDDNSDNGKNIGKYYKNYDYKPWVECRKCKQRGHYANACRSDIEATNFVEIVDSDSEETELNFIELIELDSSKACKVVQGDLLKTDVTVGNYEFVGLLDTAATCCFMSERAAKRAQLDFSSDCVEQLLFGTVSNNVCKTLGLAKNVTISVLSSCVRLEVMIIDCKYDLILGIPWFEAVGASLKFDTDKSRILSIGNVVLQLPMTNEKRLETNNGIGNQAKKLKLNKVDNDSDENDMVSYHVTNNNASNVNSNIYEQSMVKDGEQNNYDNDPLTIKQFESINELVGLNVVPNELERYEIIRKAHEEGHCSPSVTIGKINKSFRWKSMNVDVMDICLNCKQCAVEGPNPAAWRPSD